MPLNPPMADWSGRTAWLVGASSGIGRATAARLAQAGAHVVVSARNPALLDDFVAAHPGSEAIALDATDRDAMHAAARRIVARNGRIDLALYCAGTYTAMRATAFDLDTALDHLRVNHGGALVWLDAVLPQLLAQSREDGAARRPGGAGHLSLVASVAGYRGLPQALAYGPTKSALINLAETLYLDLAALKIGVSLVNPGFVATPMTAANRFPMPALLTPDAAAREIVAGWARGEFEIHFPKRFTLWLKGLQLLGYGGYFAALRRALPR